MYAMEQPQSVGMAPSFWGENFVAGYESCVYSGLQMWGGAGFGGHSPRIWESTKSFTNFTVVKFGEGRARLHGFGRHSAPPTQSPRRGGGGSKNASSWNTKPLWARGPCNRGTMVSPMRGRGFPFPVPNTPALPQGPAWCGLCGQTPFSLSGSIPEDNTLYWDQLSEFMGIIPHLLDYFPFFSSNTAKYLK